MEREKALEMALGQIEKSFGKGAIMRLGEESKVKIASIPTGALSLDLALGIGGLPRGRVVELYGPESSGKTTVALHVIAEAQAAGGIAAFIDAEHALDPSYAAALGVDVEALLVSQPDTGEQALEIADMLIRSGAIDILVIDSVAALTPRAEIEGEMGDTHVGLQARLMSQALRKLAGNLHKSRTCAVFINQLREKIGVMFGCVTWDTRVTLADGTQEKIGKIVNQRMPVEVLSYDSRLGKVVPRKVTGYFDNGSTDKFLHIRVARSGPTGRGHAWFACTGNHQVMTPAGWREAQELVPGDRVMQAVPHHLSEFQWEVLLGGLMGDSALSRNQNGYAARLRWGHGRKQVAYAAWKASLFANIGTSRSTNAKGAVFHDMPPLAELIELREAVYIEGKKVLSWDYLKRLTPLALAVWYMDDGTFTLRSKGLQERTRGGSGRSEICVQALEDTSRRRLAEYLNDECGIAAKLVTRAGQAVLRFSTAETAKLHELIAQYVHPSMDYKLLPRLRGRFDVEPQFQSMRYEMLPMPITQIEWRPPTGHSTHRFDIGVEGTHNYFVDGVMVHNSPEITPGGRALKFYSSVRLDVRRIESLKDGTDAVGNRVRVKVVKNKCLAAGTRVFDPVAGVARRIEDIVNGDEPVSVWAADKAGRLHIRPVLSRFDQGVQDVIGLRLRDGTTLRVTPDHKVLTEQGWQAAAELKAGDRIARPRHAGSFGNAAPISPDEARLLGARIANQETQEQRVPAAFFAPDICAEVVGNLLFGIWESDGWVSREQTGGIRCGFTTTSEQLAQQLHWLLLRWGVGSSVKAYRPGARRSLIAGRPVMGKLPVWEVRVSGIDNVERFASALPMWGPKGQKLSRALADPALAKHRGSQRVYLSHLQTQPVIGYLQRLGVTASITARLVGKGAGNPKGGLKQVLGTRRLRRDRVSALAEALDSDFLREVLAEDLWYDRITAVTPAEPVPTFDVEVDELHNLVAEDVVVHNCAPPFRQAEFDIMYGEGISKEGSILDIGVEHGIVKKAGAWYTYDGEQLGQGRENARSFLKEHTDVRDEIAKKVSEQLGLVPTDVTGDDALAAEPEER